MRCAIGIIGVLTATCLAAADETLPKPKLWTPPSSGLLPVPPPGPLKLPDRPFDAEDGSPKAPRSQLKQLLEELGKERQALEAAQGAVMLELKQSGASTALSANVLKWQIKEILTKIQTQPFESVAPSPTQPPKPGPSSSPQASSEKLPPLVMPGEPSVKSKGPAEPVDPLAVAQALFKAGSFEASLRAFRMIDLKGTKAEQRAPMQYLMGSCLRKLGKTDEALGLFREAANSKGDPQVAACAQWQLATIRWQRETLDKLGDISRRRLALDKGP